MAVKISGRLAPSAASIFQTLISNSHEISIWKIALSGRNMVANEDFCYLLTATKPKNR
jgi:hypothetical protein